MLDYQEQSLEHINKQKFWKEIADLNDTSDQMDLIDIFIAFHSKATEYTFFSSAYTTVTKICLRACCADEVAAKAVRGVSRMYLVGGGDQKQAGVAKACDGQGSEPRGASQQDWGLEGAPGRTVRTDLGGSLGGKRSSLGPRTGRVRAE